MTEQFTSAHDALAALAKETVSAENLATAYLDRIAARNPEIRAISDVLSDTALAAARDIDARRARGERVGPMHGLPVVVKDLIDVAGARGKAGLDFLADYIASEDAELVRRLREADAVILAVSETDSGAFLVRTPQTRHPHAPGRVVGGSSGGSGAAVAAGFCTAAIGTDTGGSVRIPAACCSIVGFKPTTGRVPLEGVRPLAWSLDHAGPLVPSAADVTILAQVLDKAFDATGKGTWPKGLIGYDPAYFRDAVDEVKAGFERAMQAAQDVGFRLAEVTLPDPDDVLSFHLVNLPAEAAAYHFEAFPDHLEDYPAEVRAGLEVGRREPAYRYVQAERRRQVAREAVDAVFEEVDFLLAPTLPVLPPKLEDEAVVTGKGRMPVLETLIRYTCLFNQTGHPVVSLPMTRDAEGIGGSVQAIGRRDGDRDVVEFAVRLEACRGPL